MESHLCSYDMITVWTILFNTIFTGHFDHCLVSLCTRVLIENLVHSDCFTDLLSKQCLRDCVWIVECMHDVANLIFNYNLRVTVSCTVYCNTSIKIKIWGFILIINVHALCCLCKEIKSLISLDHVLVYFVLNVLKS